MTERPEFHDNPEVYSQLAGFEGDWRDTWHHPDFLALMIERWGARSARRVLDVGSGAGHWGQLLLRQLPASVELVGVDREPGFITTATERAQRLGLGDRARYQQGDALALPFEDGSFDMVTCQTVLIHVDAERALAEMRRVLEPGGLLAVSEPDNLASTMALLNTSLDTPDSQVRDILELQQTSERGKRARGEGNSSIGGLLPGLLAAAGFVDVQSYTGDKCAALLPPYRSASEQLDLEQHLGWYKRGISSFTGTEEDSRRWFLAGGGSAARFAELWAATQAWMAAFVRAVESNELHAGRGFVTYLVSGRKPPAAGS